MLVVMHIRVFLHLLVAGVTLFESGYGRGFCDWSRRIIPGGATGNFTVEVPISFSYWSGYINNVPFGTYPWAIGWCTYKQDYFRCSYGERDDIYTAIITLPKVETISYVMLQDDHPITLHRAEDKTVPGFYVKESDRLDICSQYYTILLRWHFNGNESELQNVRCYHNGKLFCSGLQPFELKKSEKCSFLAVVGGISIGYMFYKPQRRFGYYYCYADKDLTKALTYIVDWKNATRTRDASVMAKSIENIPKASSIATSGTESILCKISLVWMLLISAMNSAPT
ncbi:hypothetical protein SprV_0602081400 [Sparganum proliferum]